MSTTQLLSGVRIIESSLLGPGQISTFFSDLGADVIKVEPPQGDYIRQMTWPIIDGVSLLHLHTHRGKRSIALNLKTDEGLGIYKQLVSSADAVVEAMRPGTLEKLGLGYEVLQKINPKIVSRLTITDLRRCGLSRMKALGIKSLANKILDKSKIIVSNLF